MKRLHILALAFSLMLLNACSPRQNISNIDPQKNIVIDVKLVEDPNFNQVIAPYKSELEKQMNIKISHTSVELNKTGDNSNLGNLLADFTYDGAAEWGKKNNIPQIDGGVINIGGIRTIIPQGDITIKQIFEVMPFENEIVIVKIKGSDLEDMFKYYLENKTNNPVSHITILTSGNQIKTGLISGQPIDKDKIYNIATSDYLAMGGDRMYFFNKGQMIGTGIKMRDLFIQKFKENKEVKVPTDIRLDLK
ncbi:5'-nucleotidase C-terminal domain-containing protein [Soonwooa purpurea]